MQEIDTSINVIVHTRSLIGGEVLAGSRHIFTLEDLRDYQIHCGESGINILYIEDIEMRPFVRTYMDVMRGLGLSFTSKEGMYYYYIDGKPCVYPDTGKGPSAFEGRFISELEMKLAIQSHINSLTGETLEEEFSYIEGKHQALTNSDTLMGQMSIDDYIEEE